MFSLEVEKWDCRWSLKSLSDLTCNELMRYLSSIGKAHYKPTLGRKNKQDSHLKAFIVVVFLIQPVELSNDKDLWSATKIESRLLESYWWSIYFVSLREKWDKLIYRYLIFHKEFWGKSRILTHFNLLKEQVNIVVLIFCYNHYPPNWPAFLRWLFLCCILYRNTDSLHNIHMNS